MTMTAKDVAARFEEALYTLKRLPKAHIMGYHTLWPAIVYTDMEVMQQEKLPMRLGPPLPKAIDRMEETFNWIFWLKIEEREIIWLRARRMPWRGICMRVGLSKTAAWKRWSTALEKIAHQKNKKAKTK